MNRYPKPVRAVRIFACAAVLPIVACAAGLPPNAPVPYAQVGAERNRVAEPFTGAQLAQNRLPNQEWVQDTIEFDGLAWSARRHDAPGGPGNNWWLDMQPGIERARDGLHLRIVRTGTRWTSAEIATNLPAGPCRVAVEVVGDLAGLDPNVVLGVFVYRNDQSEFDFEASRWGKLQTDNALFSVVPTVRRGHQHAWHIRDGVDRFWITFEWRASQITFGLRRGMGDIEQWVYRGTDTPAPNGHRLHINLWQRGYLRAAPVAAEVVISQVSITPLSD